MAFRLHLVLVYITLYLLLINYISSNVLQQSEETKNVGFSWGSCASNTDPLHITALNLSPDPIRLPGQVTVTVALNLTKPFPVDLSGSVSMEKKVAGIWIKVPCEHGVGSCSYEFCTNKTTQIYPSFFGENAPPKKCPPIPAGIYSMSGVSVEVSKSIPSIAEGEFKIHIDLHSTLAGHVTCLNLNLNLK